MAWRAVLVAAAVASAGGDPTSCNPAPEMRNRRDIVNDIFGNYCKENPPTDAWNAEVNATLVYIIFEEMRGDLNVLIDFTLTWTDSRLKWDKGKKLTEIKVDETEIWIPDVLPSLRIPSLRNYADDSITVTNEGKVRLQKPLVGMGDCQIDFTNWPFDSHICEVIVASWENIGEATIRNTSQLWGDLKGRKDLVQKHSEWSFRQENRKIVRTTSSTNLVYEFRVARNGNPMVYMMIPPGIAFVVLTLCSFFLDVKSSDRWITCSTAFIGCTFMLYFLSVSHMMNHATTTPAIFWLYGDCEIVVTIVLVSSTVTRWLATRTDLSPSWMEGVVFSVPGRYLLFRLNGPEANSSTERKNEIWQQAATLLDRVACIVVTVSMVAILLVRIPSPPSLEENIFK